MISLDLPGARFNYRAVGVILHDGHVLLHRAEADNFWSLPGGRCEAGETSAAALARELREEMGVEVRVERLLWVAEVFFASGGTLNHELGLNHLASLPAGSPRLDLRATFSGQEEDIPLIFRWFPLAKTPRLRLYPVFLRSRLAAIAAAIPTTVEHVCDHETEDEDGDDRSAVIE